MRNAIEQPRSEWARRDTAAIEGNSARERHQRRSEKRRASTHAEACRSHRQIALLRVSEGGLNVGLQTLGRRFHHVTDAPLNFGLRIAAFEFRAGAVEQLRRNGEIALLCKTFG